MLRRSSRKSRSRSTKKLLRLDRRSIIKKNLPAIRVPIELDRFKPLFREALKLDYELGFSLSHDNKFEISKGETTVTMPYRHVLAVHTHPNSLYDSDFKPPTHTDYAQCIWDAFSSRPIDVVIDSAGMWVYSPNQALINEVLEIQPNISDLVKGQLIEGEISRSIDVGDNLFELIDVVMHNTNQALLHLTCPRDYLIFLLVEKMGMDRDKVEHLTKNKLMKLANWRQTTLDEYLDEVADITGSGIGFDVSFTPWDEEFKVVLKQTPRTLAIWREIRNRGLAVFDENDAHMLQQVADATPLHSILRKGSLF